MINVILIIALDGMNKLPARKRAQLLEMLVEGMSMRSASRIADVSITTVAKLLVDAGEACAVCTTMSMS